MDTILGLVFLLLIGLYLYAGDAAIQYLKYHVLGIRIEVSSNIIDYIGNRAIFAAMFGWAAIPLALLHRTFFGQK